MCCHTKYQNFADIKINISFMDHSFVAGKGTCITQWEYEHILGISELKWVGMCNYAYNC